MAAGFNKYDEYPVEKFYTISESDLKYWVEAGLKYLALSTAGVNKWSYYYDALDDFKNNPAEEEPEEYGRITEDTIADLVKERRIKEW